LLANHFNIKSGIKIHEVDGKIGVGNSYNNDLYPLKDKK